MSLPSRLVITRHEPTADDPERRVLHRVDQGIWFALFGRYRTASTTPSPGQRLNDKRIRPLRPTAGKA